MTFSVGSVRGARLGFHDAENDASTIMPLFRPEQDKKIHRRAAEQRMRTEYLGEYRAAP
jgi:hypothetical protein